MVVVGRPKPVVGVLKNGETGPPMATVSVGFLGVPSTKSTRTLRPRQGRGMQPSRHRCSAERSSLRVNFDSDRWAWEDLDMLSPKRNLAPRA